MKKQMHLYSDPGSDIHKRAAHFVHLCLPKKSISESPSVGIEPTTLGLEAEACNRLSYYATGTDEREGSSTRRSQHIQHFPVTTLTTLATGRFGKLLNRLHEDCKFNCLVSCHCA